jgi:hypothetical protein
LLRLALITYAPVDALRRTDLANTVDRPTRPYLGQRELDDLMRMNSELLAELWILRDRVTVLEHLLEEKSLLTRREISDHVPCEALAAELTREREALVERVAGAALATRYTYTELARQGDVG